MLRTIKIDGFRSIKNLPEFELRPINILIGANGSGKSNLVSFFHMLNYIVQGRFSDYAASWTADALLFGGSKITREISCSLAYGKGAKSCVYDFVLSFGLGGKLFFREEKIREGGGKTQILAKEGNESALAKALLHSECEQNIRDELLSCCVYHFNDTSPTASVMRPQYIEDNRELKNFDNLAAFLYGMEINHREDYLRIVKQIKQVAPFFEDFDLQTQQTNPTNILLNWKQTGSNLLFAPYQFSDGTLRAIGLITLLMQPKAGLPRLIVLDEPELGLHPFAIELISAMIRSVSKSTQVIIATQSPQLVNEFEPEDVIVVSRHEGASVFKRLSRKELDAWLKDYTLGELWQKNVLEGGPNYQETRHA